MGVAVGDGVAVGAGVAVGVAVGFGVPATPVGVGVGVGAGVAEAAGAGEAALVGTAEMLAAGEGFGDAVAAGDAVALGTIEGTPELEVPDPLPEHALSSASTEMAMSARLHNFNVATFLTRGAARTFCRAERAACEAAARRGRPRRATRAGNRRAHAKNSALSNATSQT